MAESVDATVSNTVGAIHPGSSPGPGTKKGAAPLLLFFIPGKSHSYSLKKSTKSLIPPILLISPIPLRPLITLISLKKFALQVLKKVKSEKFCGRIC